MSKYIFFYGGYFSQWFPCNFKVDDISYNCAEQYMMHKKALLFNDEEIARQIMSKEHPRNQKALGRQVQNFVVDVWNRSARDIVYQGNYAKFQQNPNLLDKLFETKDSILVEASPVDKIWGIGLSMTDERRYDASNWLGTNWLGQVLTKVRNDLKSNVFEKGSFQWD